MIDYDEMRTRLLDEASAILSRKDKAKSDFVRHLFAHGLAEDLVCYDAGMIAQFAEKALSAMQRRKKSQPIIAFNSYENAALHEDGKKLSITTIDIINDNMPFLIDSVVPELRDLGHEIRLIVHPILMVDRARDGVLSATPRLFKTDNPTQATRESMMHIHIGAVSAVEQRRIKAALADLLKDVRHVVGDWRQMIEKLAATIRSYKSNPPPIEVHRLAEAVQFLEWLMENNYTFLGAREYRYDDRAERFVQPIKGSGLGILQDPSVHILKRGDELVEITPEIREFMIRPDPLIISKANVRSRIHRRIHMDYIGVKLYDVSGQVTGELRLVGLFTSTVYAYSINAIPYLRHKAHQVMEASGFDANSHSGKALWSVLESYPRDELFQIGAQQLEEFALSILALDGRSKVRVLPRWDRFDRYVSVLVYVPRDRYNTDVRIKIGDYLSQVFEGAVSSFYPGFPEGLLARVHFIIRRKMGERPAIVRSDLERAITGLIATWEDGLTKALSDSEEARLIKRYHHAFSAAYREAFEPAQALHDLYMVEKLVDAERIEAEFYRRADMPDERVGLKLFHLETPIELSTRVPMLEFMGFRVINERTYRIEPEGGRLRYLHDMTLATSSGRLVDLGVSKERLEAMLLAIWQEQTGNDGYNALAVTGGLNWRDVAMLRTVSRYLQQIGVAYSQEYMWQALNRNAAIAVELVSLFHARFDPKVKSREKAQAAILQQIDTALEAVASLDEDQIIRRFRDIIMGSVRTNFFKRDEKGEPLIEVSLKLAPREIDGIPEPRPLREIFMTSPRVEGLHLRFGKVARGGLRWSDRPEDFRTEVLGLVKAQQVKNAVIVPVGSKGGFVPKKLHAGMSRDDYLTEGTNAYKIFVANLLELTDNLDGDKIIHPKNVVRHEGDDPYLVVAADKGTATFSDTANGISQAYHFWLDDAFASGGSAGYDHKKMGITARGGWEAVKRHFREMNKDIQSEPFTVAGVGDMSGDVFGNGMLLSQQIKLIAAFDHRDIFFDPDPDPAVSFNERQRIFNLGRSSWQDYDKHLISGGGGVFPRSAKSIALTTQMQKALDVKKTAMSPFELMQSILKMKVELFWFGGIGTYIRGPLESNAEVGDRANDLIRITADEVGAKVIGEGANLGMTQRARIAFNKRGGRCNSDAIDNSAGVNSSDVEVNIKIALGAAVRAGKLTIAERNRLLEAMTEEVGSLVLRNNYLQTLSLSITEQMGMADFDHQVLLIQSLEARGLLNRKVEDLPSNEMLEERRAAAMALTRPEIGVLFAYAKITLFDELIESQVPDDAYLERELIRYFPQDMQKKYAHEIASHKLRREIIATQICNAMINRGGATYLGRVQSDVSADAAMIAKAYIVVRDAFAMQELYQRLDALDTIIDGAVQLELYGLVRQLLISQTVWVLKHIGFENGIEAEITPIASGIKALMPKISSLLPKRMHADYEKRRKSYLKAGVPEDIAVEFALLPVLDLVPTVIAIARETKKPLNECAHVYFGLDGLFSVSRIDELALEVETLDYYDALALARGRAQLGRAHWEMTRKVLTRFEGEKAALAWQKIHQKQVDEVSGVIDGILEGEKLSVAKLSVAANLIEELARA